MVENQHAAILEKMHGHWFLMWEDRKELRQVSRYCLSGLPTFAPKNKNNKRKKKTKKNMSNTLLGDHFC